MGKEPYTVGGNRASAGETEKGYTRLMRENILSTERSIRRKKDEELHVFDSKGNFVKSFQGEGAGVNGVSISSIPENSILTHNHPRALGRKGVYSIGNSFSADDVNTAVTFNAKEIRAVTPTYTFSIKRPKNGWGASPAEATRAFNKIYDEVSREFGSYVSRRSYSYSAVSRAETRHFHEINKRLAKRFGWIYTKKKN